MAAICAEAGISEPTLYEYFGSKEDVLFSISELYTRREFERFSELAHFINDPRERVRAIIQAYLEFYEHNPLYTSVALLTLKGNRRYLASPAYQSVRDAARRPRGRDASGSGSRRPSAVPADPRRSRPWGWRWALRR